MATVRRHTLLSAASSVTLPTLPLSSRRDSAFGPAGGALGGGANGAGFFPILKDTASQANEKERIYYQKEEEKIFQTVAQMEKCQILTDQMLGILDSFDDKLSALESSMIPIHKGTQALTTAQKNIDSTLRETDKIILHYSIATESEDSINSHLLNSIDYVSYLEWVEKIHLSINFFAKNRERLHAFVTKDGNGNESMSTSSSSSISSSSSVLGVHSSDFEKYLKRLKELNKRVMLDCEHEFERVLSSSSKNPIDLTRTGWPLPNMMSSEVGGVGGGMMIPYQLVPELSVRELSLLATRMALAGHQTYYGVILAQRSGFLKASLKKIFHEEVRFIVNKNDPMNQQQSQQQPQQQQQQQQLMHLRGSVIHSSTTPSGVHGLGSYGSSVYEPPTPTGWSSSGGFGASSLNLTGVGSTNTSSTSSSGAPQLYLKDSHRSVFYLEFFLKLLELENSFILQLVSHIFNAEELRSNGLPPASQTLVAAREESMLTGSGSSSSSGVGTGMSGQSGKASSSAGNLLSSALTSATTGNLTVFWGQEAYDQLFANIVEVPLEYFKKKLEQSTYLKDTTSTLATVLSGVLGSSNSSSSSGVGGSGSGGKGSGGVGSGGSGSASSSGSDHPGHVLSNKILILLDVLDHLDALLPRYRLSLKKQSQFEKMTDFQQQVTTLARKSIQEYREYIVDYSDTNRKGVNKGIGRDGTIYTLTVETLNFIRRLYEYRRVIEHTTTLVDKHHAGQAAQAEKEAREREQQELNQRFGVTGERPTGITAEDNSPLTRLVSFLLSGLEANMDSKSKSYKLPSLSAIFLLNNFHYASRFLKKYETIFLSGGIYSPGNLQATLERYDKLVHTTMKQYRTVSWEKIVTQALETSDLVDLYRAYASAVPGSSNHKAARKAIKQKFAFFNTTFDELYHTQRYFAVPDSDLRSQLRNDNVELIIQGFSPVNFSTTPAKYMKYRPDTVESMLNKFFDETTT